MKFLNVVLLIILVALLIFAALNWSAIVSPIPLSLLFTNMDAPLGLILLSVTGVLVLLFLSFVVYMQSSTILLRKRLNIELATQRELADKAEASRFTELRTYLEYELQSLKTQNTETHQQVEVRLAETEAAVKAVVEETGRTLSAYIGELEDRLEKK
ncbi:MAG: LapA family protein [Methylophilaceae bacterium]|nr:LapA family protein [Methylophilaceae bacterium]MDG1453207.1 LapA family protein [Methylophilaceae bacterium]